jgi:hypothetical protein
VVQANRDGIDDQNRPVPTHAMVQHIRLRLLRTSASDRPPRCLHERRLVLGFQGKSCLGFYPLPLSQAQRIRRTLLLPESSSAIDPCVGDGVAFEAISSVADVLR